MEDRNNGKKKMTAADLQPLNEAEQQVRLMEINTRRSMDDVTQKVSGLTQVFDSFILRESILREELNTVKNENIILLNKLKQFEPKNENENITSIEEGKKEAPVS